MSAKRFILNETSYHGHGAVEAIVTEVKGRGFTKALVVTDADLVKFGVVAKVTTLLDAAGCAYEIYDKVKANPSVDVVNGGVAAFKAAGADYMIAIGGGSPQDTAKRRYESTAVRCMKSFAYAKDEIPSLALRYDSAALHAAVC